MNRLSVKRTPYICTLLCLAAILGQAPRSVLPRIRILATGGTIAGTDLRGEKGRYKSGSMPVDDLVNTVQMVKGLADITSEQISNIGSQTMSNETWITLAKRLKDVLGDPGVDGVVITHGTDTMEETGYFLSLVMKSNKPVVMTGSMRPATAISADGPMNLYNAVAVASNPEAARRGVLVVLNDQIHYAREIEKNSTTSLNAFRSSNRGLAGLVNNGKAVFFSPPSVRLGLNSEFSVDGIYQFPRVEIVYSYANFGRELIDFLVGQGVKGIVLAGVGNGNTTDQALAGLEDAVKNGVAVVRSTRVATGVTDRNIEVNDNQLGFVAAEELNPQKARVLLMLGLGKTNDPKKLQQYFTEY